MATNSKTKIQEALVGGNTQLSKSELKKVASFLDSRAETLSKMNLQAATTSAQLLMAGHGAEHVSKATLKAFASELDKRLLQETNAVHLADEATNNFKPSI